MTSTLSEERESLAIVIRDRLSVRWTIDLRNLMTNEVDIL